MTELLNTLKAALKFVHDLERGARGRFTPMLVAMLVLFVLLPFVEEDRYSDVFMSLKFGLVIATGAYASKPRSGLSVMIIVSGIAGVIATVALHVFPGITALLVRDALMFVFCLCAAFHILGQVSRSEGVTFDSISGAICVYLLLGLIWALLYAAIELTAAGSFAMETAFGEVPSRSAHFSTFVYYSFSTLTAVGYGDIVPSSSPARVFSWLEAVVGQLYLAILIARLVGLHIIAARSREKEKP